MNNVDHIRAILDLQFKGAAQANQIDKAMKDIEKSVNTAQVKVKGLNGALLGFSLSALFAGMALKRLGENIIKSLVKTYMTATDEQSRFNQALLGVQASFEFLKFSIMDALGNSDLVLGMIDAIISLTNTTSAFVNKHPFISKLIGLFAVGAALVGGFIMVIGQIGSALVGAQSFVTLFGESLKGITLTTGTPWVAAVLAVAAAAYVIYDYFKKHPEAIKLVEAEMLELKKSFSSVWDSIKLVLSAIGINLPDVGKFAVATLITMLKGLNFVLQAVADNFKAVALGIRAVTIPGAIKPFLDFVTDTERIGNRIETGIGLLSGSTYNDVLKQLDTIEMAQKKIENDRAIMSIPGQPSPFGSSKLPTFELPKVTLSGTTNTSATNITIITSPPTQEGYYVPNERDIADAWQRGYEEVYNRKLGSTMG